MIKLYEERPVSWMHGPCEYCDGTGIVAKGRSAAECTECKGTGRVLIEVRTARFRVRREDD